MKVSVTHSVFELAGFQFNLKVRLFPTLPHPLAYHAHNTHTIVSSISCNDLRGWMEKVYLFSQAV